MFARSVHLHVHHLDGFQTMMEDTDCIVGVATGTPDGGVSVVRLSGGQCSVLGTSLLGSLPIPRVASLRRLADASGALLDEALVLWMPGPASFTGEDVLELHVHAGHENVRQVLVACVAAGARPALAGEFSRRAFARGKMSLDQAEALPALLAAQSESELGRARRLLRGELGERVDAMMRELFTLRVEIEAHLDFPEDLSGEASGRWIQALGSQLSCLRGWLSSHRSQEDRGGRFRVALAGPPNAGKSSLFNALLRRQRSIVSQAAGTTRDFVEAPLRWSGLALDLVDTAGLRDGAGPIESAGIEMGRAEIEQADLVIWMQAEASQVPALPEMLVGQRSLILVASKCDVATVPAGWLGVSVRPGFEASVDELRQRIETWMRDSALSVDEDWVGLARHAACVSGAAEEIEAVLVQLAQPELALEIVAFHLGAAGRALGEIRGRDKLNPVGEDVLHAIFSSFCIGK